MINVRASNAFPPSFWLASVVRCLVQPIRSWGYYFNAGSGEIFFFFLWPIGRLSFRFHKFKAKLFFHLYSFLIILLRCRVWKLIFLVFERNKILFGSCLAINSDWSILRFMSFQVIAWCVDCYKKRWIFCTIWFFVVMIKTILKNSRFLISARISK